MRTLLLTIRYDGRPYHGWQIQSNADTVQARLQDALAEIFGEAPPLKGCSRTDAGVHARKFCVSLAVDSRIPCERLVMALNAKLPRSIAVLDCAEVREDFHARYCALGKRYSYEIWNSPRRDPFREGLAAHIPFPRLDADRMRENGLPLLGRHDFAAFRSAGSTTEGTVRTITQLDVVRDGDLVRLTVAADGFLYNMVRIITGTLVDMERGSIPHGTMADVIASLDRSCAGVTAPPDGLYLEEIYYPEDIFA